MIEEQDKKLIIDEIKAVHPNHIAIAAIKNDMDPDEFVGQCCMGVIAAARVQFERVGDNEVMIFKAKGTTITVHFETGADYKPSGAKKPFVNIPA